VHSAQANAPSPTPVTEAVRKRVAVEMVARHEAVLRRTARRYSICAEDAEDAYQRALEILLLKAPQGSARELVRWMQTVTKHEALAVRRSRERQMGPAPRGTEEPEDWVAQIPSGGAGPEERVERRESIARSREALQALKPQELRALTLLAEGYSYTEIGEITGYSRTKVNRCLAEGRERYRSIIARSESGGRCAELRPILSAFCDGEADPREAATLREHLRACAHCRAAVRAYRAAPGAAAALLPLPLAAPSLLDRAQQALAGLQERVAGRMPGSNADAAAQLATSGGASGAGVAVAAKTLAICVGAAGGAAACVGAGVVPSPLAAEPGSPAHAQIRPAPSAAPAGPVSDGESEAESQIVRPEDVRTPPPEPQARADGSGEGSAPESGGVEYTPAAEAAPAPEVPAPPPTPPPPPAETEPSVGSAAGEFGP